MQNTSYKVIIVGAGPAGLASSLTLSAYNIPHCIIDAHTKAVLKPGDALPPNAKPLLKQLGILNLLNHPNHIPYYGNKSIWGEDSIRDKEFIEGLYGHGYLLDRLYFEEQLRTLVTSKNVSFYKGFQVKKVFKRDGKVEVVIQNKTEQKRIDAEYIIDATGRKASVSRYLGGQKVDLDKQITVSFWHQLTCKMPRQIWIEATENGWWYLSPNASHQVNCMFFTNKKLLPKSNQIHHFLKEELLKTKQIQQLIQPTAEELLENKLMPSGTSCLDTPYGDRWLAVGDAAFSYDPISSYGITSALATGFYGGHAIASQLKGEKDAFLTYRYVLENGAKSYLQKLSHQYNMEKRWEDSLYWKERLPIGKSVL